MSNLPLKLWTHFLVFDHLGTLIEEILFLFAQYTKYFPGWERRKEGGPRCSGDFILLRITLAWQPGPASDWSRGGEPGL